MCPNTTADIAGMVLITAVMSLDGVRPISSHIDTVRLS